MKKRLSRYSRRSIVGVIVGLAFAAAAGVGLAQITADTSPTAAAASTTTQTTNTTSTSSSGQENDFADDDDSQGDEELEFEQAKKTTTTTTTTSTAGTTTSGQQTITGADEGNGQQKVDVCHVTGSGKSHTINIAEPAVAAHIAHGDTEGACAATTTAAATTTTTAAVAPQSSTRVKKPKHVQTSHATTKHTSHGKSGGQKSHGNSGSKGNGGGQGNGHGK